MERYRTESGRLAGTVTIDVAGGTLTCDTPVMTDAGVSSDESEALRELFADTIGWLASAGEDPLRDTPMFTVDIDRWAHLRAAYLSDLENLFEEDGR